MTPEEKKKVYDQSYRESNREKINNYARVYNQANRDKLKDNRLRRTYGITLEEYNKMFEDQNGCCAICNEHQLTLNQILYVDHCHESGRVRGLLCLNCNILLGKAKDSEKILFKAIEYLKKK